MKVESVRRGLTSGAALLALVMAWQGPAQATVLSDLADGMAPGTWAEMPPNSSLNDMNYDPALFYFANGGSWDPIQDKVMWVGGPGSCCVSNPIYKLITYDAQADRWDIRSTPYGGTGHGYDGNAVDPVNSTFFFVRWGDPDIKTWDGNSWDTLPDYPGNPTSTNALTWFPDLNNGQGGLLLVRKSGRLAWYNVNNQTWTEIPTSHTWDGSNFAEYNPVERVVWFGSSDGHFKLDAQGNVTKLSSAPINLKTNRSLHAVDSSSGLFLVYHIETGDWWDYDIVADNWSRLNGLSSAPNAPNDPQFVVSIHELGVILVYSQDGGRSVNIYKHSPGERDTVAPAAPSGAAAD